MNALDVGTDIYLSKQIAKYILFLGHQKDLS